jgi:hypothetical protein
MKKDMTGVCNTGIRGGLDKGVVGAWGGVWGGSAYMAMTRRLTGVFCLPELAQRDSYPAGISPDRQNFAGWRISSLLTLYFPQARLLGALFPSFPIF